MWHWITCVCACRCHFLVQLTVHLANFVQHRKLRRFLVSVYQQYPRRLNSCQSGAIWRLRTSGVLYWRILARSFCRHLVPRIHLNPTHLLRYIHFSGDPAIHPMNTSSCFHTWNEGARVDVTCPAFVEEDSFACEFHRVCRASWTSSYDNGESSNRKM